MPIVDDYNIISGQGWDCEATTGWSASAGVTLGTTTDSVQGTNAITIRADSAGEKIINNTNVPANYRIDQKPVLFWFKYAKGKSPPYLTSNNQAVRARVHVGTVGNYFEYFLTDLGDEELFNGYQVFQFSGSAFDAQAGTPVITNDVVRLDLVLQFANPNNSANDDAPLLMDCWFTGTKIGLEQGTEGAPATFADIENYSDTRAAFPLGVVRLSTGFANVRCGLDIGGSAAGFLKATDTYILINQFSQEVKANITLNSNGGIQTGELDNGVAVRGCQVVWPESRFSDIIQQDGAVFRGYNSKVFRGRNLVFGGVSDAGSVTDLRDFDVGSCETVYFRANTLDINKVQVHDATANVRNHATEFSKTPNSSSELLVYSNNVGAKAVGNAVVNGLRLQDNTTDIEILEGVDFDVRNGNFDETKLTRVLS